MTTVGIAMCLDEVDVAEGVLRHTAAEVDHLLVADNQSSDGTRDILDRLAAELPMTVVDDPVRAYNQSEKMSALAERAATEFEADWVVPFDFDELWVAHADRIRVVLAELDADVAQATLINHLRSQFADVDDPDPFRSMVWRQREPARLPKVAIRWRPGAVIHQGNHGVTLPGTHLIAAQALEIRHFPIRSAAQMVTKTRNGAAAYAATDLPWTEGQHWRSWGLILDKLGPYGLEDVYNTYWRYRSPVDAGLIHDPAPYLRWAAADDAGL